MFRVLTSLHQTTNRSPGMATNVGTPAGTAGSRRASGGGQRDALELPFAREIVGVENPSVEARVVLVLAAHGDQYGTFVRAFGEEVMPLVVET